MSQPRYVSFDEYYKDIVRHTVDECVLCGECVRGCMTYPITSLKDEPPEDIMEKMIDFLKDGEFSEEVYLKAFSCTGCGDCSDLCPQEIDPMLTHEAIKIELLKQGKSPPSNDIFTFKNINPVEILSCLQTKPSDEVGWLKSVPSKPEETENLVFLGCAPPGVFPNRVSAFLNILDNIGGDFVTLAGGDLCCGARFCPSLGMIKEAEDSARELVKNIKAFSPKRVILFCPGCYRQFTEFFPNFLDMDFEVQLSINFISENIEKLHFKKTIEKTVAFHDSCVVRRNKDSDKAINLLKAIPGLKLVELDHMTEQKLCCGGMFSLTYPKLGRQLRNSISELTRQIEADTGER